MPFWLQQIDASIFLFLNRGLANPVFDVLMPFITEADHWTVPLGVAALLLAVKGGVKGRVTLLLAVVVVALSDQVTCSLIKPWVARTRPCFVLESARLLIRQSNSFSFPSAHAANNAAVAVLIWMRYPQARWWFVGIALSVAYSRIYVGVHYPVDVLAGLLLGASLSFGVVALWNRLASRRSAKKAKEASHEAAA